MQFSRLFAGVALSFSMMAGCYGAGDTLDESGATTEEVSARVLDGFTGAWVGDSGSFHALVFTATTEGAGRHYFADVDTGIRCVRAPCPSEARIEGRFTAGTRNVTLRGDTSAPGASLLGTYAYALTATTLTLSQNGRVVARLHKVTSYCAEADDCGEQRLITPRCLGSFSCTAEHTCRYTCGRPAAGLGELCGGIAAIQCGAGLTCELSGTNPDASGTCRRTPSGVGEMCGGIAGLQCADGLICQLSGTNPDASGTCRITRCATVRCTATTHCVDNGTSASCVPNGPSCAAIRRASGYTCQETNGVGACVANPVVRCGTATCGTGTYCCNPLRNLCAPIGRLCIQ